MGVDALAALLFGWLFDRIGKATMMIVAALSAFYAPLVVFSVAPQLASIPIFYSLRKQR
jgi:MFS family permease